MLSAKLSSTQQNQVLVIAKLGVFTYVLTHFYTTALWCIWVCIQVLVLYDIDYAQGNKCICTYNYTIMLYCQCANVAATTAPLNSTLEDPLTLTRAVGTAPQEVEGCTARSV